MDEHWINALERAALPGAVRVDFSQTLHSGRHTRFQLKCFDADGAVIGDGRDYDVLKAVFGPLERCAKSETHGDFTLSLNRKTGVLTRS